MRNCLTRHSRLIPHCSWTSIRVSVKINKCVVKLPPTIIFESRHEAHCSTVYDLFALVRNWHRILGYDGFARLAQAYRCNLFIFNVTQILNGLQHQVV